MSEDTLEQVAADVRRCQKCRLFKTATQGVPGEGSPTAEVMFIGEGPGYHEDQQGRPFVGVAGQLLDEMIARIGLRRADVFITNVVRHRPPDNRDPAPDELAACDEYTQRQIALLRPRLIVTLGRYSMARFFGADARISRIHGQTTRWNGITCLAMYHPAAVLRAQSSDMRRAYADDFARIPALLQQVERQPEPHLPPGSPEKVDQLPLF